MISTQYIPLWGPPLNIYTFREPSPCLRHPPPPQRQTIYPFSPCHLSFGVGQPASIFMNVPRKWPSS